MKLECKSMFIGIVLGAISVSAIFFLFGDVEKEFFFQQKIRSKTKTLK